MKKLNKINIFYFIIVFIVLIILGTLISIYFALTNNIVEKTMLDNINEIAMHDRNTIIMFIEHNWKNLERIGERLKRNQETLDTKRAINEYLSYEAYESTFDKVYLLMDDGSYYTDITYRPNSDTPDYYDYGRLFQDVDSYKVIGFDSLPVMNDDKVIIYAYDLSRFDFLDNISIGNDGTNGERKKVRAVVGITKRSAIIDGLVIESFVDSSGNVQGYSSVVTYDGEFIVDRKNIADAGDNWFTLLDSDDSSLSSGTVKAKMQAGETFWFYSEDEGVRELNYCIPLNDTIGWYFLMSISSTALHEQTRSLVRVIIIGLTIAAAVIIIAIIILLIMQNKKEKAYAQERAQREFLSNMSHEIRTPLNGLIGLNYLMMSAIDVPEKHGQVKEWLSKSNSTAKYLLALINDILDISKLRAGKVEVVHEPLLLEAVLDSIYSMQGDNIKSRGVEYKTDVHIPVPCIIGDEVHIKQVLMNIIGNAVKFTPAGGTITLTVNQALTDERHVVTTFVCEDTGCGMSKEFTGKIFDAFTQDRLSNNDSIKGTGLGMAISRMLVRAMGGDITVESEQGVGSKFTVTIPAEVSDIPDYLKFNVDNEAERVAAERAEDLQSMKVLVAEDNELNAEILLEVLKDSGFSAEYAADGKQAVDLFESSAVGEFGVILMDMRMPVLDGCAASSKIRALDRPDAKSVVIFACTANTFKEDRIKAFDSGMDDFLTKPIDMKLLLQKIEQIERNRNATKEGEKR